VSGTGPEQSSADRRAIIGGFSLVIGGMISIWLGAAGHLSFLGVVLAFAFGAGVGWAAERLVLHSATGLVGTIFAAGNIAPPPSYPVADTLVVRGKYADAAEYFRNHLRAHPEDFAARLRLADLDVAHLADYGDAERLYKEVRDAREDPRRELAAYNGLIDLHTRTGNRDRLKVELARFADRYVGSQHALEARRRLDELKADEGRQSTSESPRSPR
jgi:tetratricopeptide (TPR) repeat protein